MSAEEPEPKRYRVEFTRGALNDMHAIKRYIESTLCAPAAARRTIEGILAVANALSLFPLRNRVLATAEDGSKIRAARSGNYTISYLIADDRVTVFSVLYSASNIAQRLEDLLAQKIAGTSYIDTP